MILDLLQISKELFSSKFTIKRGNQHIGSVFLSSKICSRGISIEGDLFGNHFFMEFGPFDTDIQVFRKYIFKNDNGITGVVYQTKSKDNFFIKYDFIQMVTSNCVFNYYPISFGELGGKCPIYFNDRQVAQVDKDYIVYNDIHNYRIYAYNDFFAKIAVLFAVYSYANSYYKPGIKVKSSYCKYLFKTKNKLLLSKYNSNFVDNVQL